MADLTRWIIPAVLVVLILFCVNELRRGLREGEMQEFTRRRYHDEGIKIIRRDKQPIAFWALFAFYVLGIIALLAMIGVVIRQSAESAAP